MGRGRRIGIIVGQMVRSSASKSSALKVRSGTAETSPTKARRFLYKVAPMTFLSSFTVYASSFLFFP